MRHESIWTCLVLTFVGTLAAGPLDGQQQESFDAGLARIADSFAQPLTGRTVAVFEFPDLESRVTNLSRLVSEQLTTELVQRLQGRGRILERRQVLQVMAELNLQKTDLTAAEVARVGRQLGADAIVLGSAVTIGEQIVVNVRAVAVTGGLVLAANRMSVQGSQNLLALAAGGVGAPSLMGRGDTGGGGSSRAAAPTPPRSAFRGQIGAVALNLLECRQAGSNVTCTVTLTNSGNEGEFTWGYESRLYDEGGNEYHPDGFSIANSGREAILVQGIPTRAALVFRNVAETHNLTLLSLRGYFDGWQTVQFRNVPVAH